MTPYSACLGAPCAPLPGVGSVLAPIDSLQFCARDSECAPGEISGIPSSPILAEVLPMIPAKVCTPRVVDASAE